MFEKQKLGGKSTNGYIEKSQPGQGFVGPWNGPSGVYWEELVVSVGNFIFKSITISLTLKSPTALLRGHADKANTKLSIHFLFSTLETIRRENAASHYPGTTTY